MNNLKPYDFMNLVDIPRSKRQRSYLYEESLFKGFKIMTKMFFKELKWIARKTLRKEEVVPSLTVGRVF